MGKDYPGKISDEADQYQLKLAAAQGEAYGDALQHMADEEADDGGQRQIGDYIVTYAIEAAEGMYEWEGSELVWHNPEEENVHIEVSVADAEDGRFVPYLNITATLFDDDGEEIDTHIQPFIWHPWLYHYGRNWVVPRSGVYRLEITIEAPSFHRHDKLNGMRYAKPAVVTFEHVTISTGQKRS